MQRLHYARAGGQAVPIQGVENEVLGDWHKLLHFSVVFVSVPWSLVRRCGLNCLLFSRFYCLKQFCSWFPAQISCVLWVSVWVGLRDVAGWKGIVIGHRGGGMGHLRGMGGSPAWHLQVAPPAERGKLLGRTLRPTHPRHHLAYRTETANVGSHMWGIWVLTAPTYWTAPVAPEQVLMERQAVVALWKEIPSQGFLPGFACCHLCVWPSVFACCGWPQQQVRNRELYSCPARGSSLSPGNGVCLTLLLPQLSTREWSAWNGLISVALLRTGWMDSDSSSVKKLKNSQPWHGENGQSQVFLWQWEWWQEHEPWKLKAFSKTREILFTKRRGLTGMMGSEVEILEVISFWG